MENAFGILANRFMFLLTTILKELDTVKITMMACLCLHNIMRIRYPTLQNLDLDRERNDHQVIPGAWRNEALLQEMQNMQGSNVATREAKQQGVYI